MTEGVRSSMNSADSPKQQTASGHKANGPRATHPRTSGDRRKIASPRVYRTTGGNEVEVRGRPKAGFDDLYHKLLTVSWGAFLGLAAAAYMGLNLVFALLFWIDRQGVSGMGRAGFADTFFFSIQTFGTIGYGAMTPGDLYTNLIVTIESFVGLGAVAVATGLIFARVSRPTARVMFSRYAVITTYEGKPTLIFRCANERANQILDAEINVSMARQVTTMEGLMVRRVLDLKVVRSKSPLFALSWMVMHVIDEDSPLYGATPQSLEDELVEVLVVLAGVDETFAQRIHARHSYTPATLAWGRQFADVLSIGEDGRRIIDYSRFHDLQDEEVQAV